MGLTRLGAGFAVDDASTCRTQQLCRRHKGQKQHVPAVICMPQQLASCRFDASRMLGLGTGIPSCLCQPGQNLFHNSWCRPVLGCPAGTALANAELACRLTWLCGCVFVQVLQLLIKLYEQCDEPEYTVICQCLMLLDDAPGVAKILNQLVSSKGVSVCQHCCGCVASSICAFNAFGRCFPWLVSCYSCACRHVNMCTLCVQHLTAACIQANICSSS